MTEDKIRVLVGKVGLDGHDRGAKVVSQHLRNAGMEVIYSGLFQMPEAIVGTAIQEDVDVVGLSILSGEHLVLPKRVVDLLKERGIRGRVLVIVGGIVPRQHFPLLREAGIDEIFETGTPMASIVKYIREEVAKKRSERG